MTIDARGLSHPDHIREFKRHLEGLCAVYEEVDVLMDRRKEDVMKMEMYIRSCRGDYTVADEEDHIRIRIRAPFYLCG